MAKVSNISIVAPAPAERVVHLAQATTTDAYAPGDFIEADSRAGTCKVADSADKSAFIGISNSCLLGSNALDKVEVHFQCTIRAPLAAGQTTIYFGEAAARSTGANGTDWSLANTATEAVVWCASDVITAGNYGRFLVDSFTLRAVTALAFFELPA